MSSEFTDKIYNIVLVVVIIISLLLVVVENYNSFTGFATEGSTTSNVTISKALSIAFSTNLSQGIYFGSVDTLPATDINGTHNNDSGANHGTSYYISVSNDSNTAIDLCIRANQGLTSATADVIGLGNETYAHSTPSTNSTFPQISSQTAMTTSYVKAGTGIAVGNSNFYRFYLDVPGAQPSGDYNNTVSFKGVVTTLAC